MANMIAARPPGYNPGQSMTTTTATADRLRIAHADVAGALLRFDFEAGEPSPQRVACERLDGPAEAECWWGGEITESAETTGAAWAHGDHYAMVAISVDECGAGIEA